MRIEQHTRLWTLALALTVPFAAHAQLGGEGLPDLSGISGAISGTVAPKGAGTFSSGLKVPSVHPGATAKGIGEKFRTAVEAKTGAKNPALQQLEDGLPGALAQMEAEFGKLGYAKRDLGVAMGYFFVTNYETATGRKVPQAASLAAARTVAKATAAKFGPRFNALPADQKESLYETLIVTPMILDAFAGQFEKAGKTQDAQGMRAAASALFQKIVGSDPATVRIDATGRISGLAGGSAVAATKTIGRGLPAGKLTASSANGARVFVMYVVSINGSSPTRELVLFPDGTAFTDLPSGPVPNFTVASLRAALRPVYVGRWSQTGNKLTVKTGKDTDVYVKDPSGGWADPDQKSGEFGIYFPVLPASAASIAGAWHNETLVSVGVAGGAGPMTYGGGTGDLVFARNGTFAKAGKGFATSSSSMGGVSAVGKGRQAQGQWRLDGLMLTTVQNGQRGVQLLYVMPHWKKSGEAPDIMIQGSRWSRPEK